MHFRDTLSLKESSDQKAMPVKSPESSHGSDELRRIVSAKEISPNSDQEAIPVKSSESSHGSDILRMSRPVERIPLNTNQQTARLRMSRPVERTPLNINQQTARLSRWYSDQNTNMSHLKISQKLDTSQVHGLMDDLDKINRQIEGVRPIDRIIQDNKQIQHYDIEIKKLQKEQDEATKHFNKQIKKNHWNGDENEVLRLNGRLKDLSDEHKTQMDSLARERQSIADTIKEKYDADNKGLQEKKTTIEKKLSGEANLEEKDLPGHDVLAGMR